MKVLIPAEVPLDQQDDWCVAYRAGYLALSRPGRVAFDQDWDGAMPEAYHAGQSQAYVDLSRKRRMR